MGLWALAILSRPEVKSAFDAAYRISAAGALVASEPLGRFDEWWHIRSPAVRRFVKASVTLLFIALAVVFLTFNQRHEMADGRERVSTTVGLGDPWIYISKNGPGGESSGVNIATGSFVAGILATLAFIALLGINRADRKLAGRRVASAPAIASRRHPAAVLAGHAANPAPARGRPWLWVGIGVLALLMLAPCVGLLLPYLWMRASLQPHTGELRVVPGRVKILQPAADRAGILSAFLEVDSPAGLRLAAWVTDATPQVSATRPARIRLANRPHTFRCEWDLPQEMTEDAIQDGLRQLRARERENWFQMEPDVIIPLFSIEYGDQQKTAGYLRFEPELPKEKTPGS